jgi:hypothetical protein
LYLSYYISGEKGKHLEASFRSKLTICSAERIPLLLHGYSLASLVSRYLGSLTPFDGPHFSVAQAYRNRSLTVKAKCDELHNSVLHVRACCAAWRALNAGKLLDRYPDDWSHISDIVIVSTRNNNAL